MKYIDKVLKDINQESDEEAKKVIIENYCPSDFRLEEDDYFDCGETSEECTNCWNREYVEEGKK